MCGRLKRCSRMEVMGAGNRAVLFESFGSGTLFFPNFFKNKKKMHKAEKKYSKAHLNRVKNEVCDASMTRYFSGIMYNFDRMADNCVSIAEEACDNVAFINLDEETGKSMMERGAV